MDGEGDSEKGGSSGITDRRMALPWKGGEVHAYSHCLLSFLRRVGWSLDSQL